MESPKTKKNHKPLRPEKEIKEKSYMKFYALAFELVALNLALILGGYYLDSLLSTSPIIILIGTFLAMAGTIWLLLKALK